MAHLPNSENEPSSKLLNEKEENPSLQDGIEFVFLTLFPEVFPGVFKSSLLGKAQEKGLISIHLKNIRDFAQDKHHKVDDTPYGGGEGMLLKADVLCAAWDSVVSAKSTSSFQKKTMTLLLSPQGEVFTQEIAKELASYSQLVFVCGHYEGVDERFIDLCVDREISIGDYVLTGGELPALVVADTVARLVPGVIGNQRSVTQDSFENGLLKYPQYTRPRELRGLKVPEVLLTGDHGAIRQWREDQMCIRTQKKRPDLWEKYRTRLKLRSSS